MFFRHLECFQSSSSSSFILPECFPLNNPFRVICISQWKGLSILESQSVSASLMKCDMFCPVFCVPHPSVRPSVHTSFHLLVYVPFFDFYCKRFYIISPFMPHVALTLLWDFFCRDTAVVVWAYEWDSLFDFFWGFPMTEKPREIWYCFN